MMERWRRARTSRGFTLIEVLIVIVVIAVLASIVVPRLFGAGRKAKEAKLRSELHTLRTAIEQFHADTGVYPQQLSDLTLSSAPSYVTAGTWQGPYAREIPKDPITGAADWNYNSSDGTVRSSASGTTLDGTPYSQL